MKIGVDIGGTKVAVCLADERGPRGKLSAPTVKSGPDDALAQQVIELARTLAQREGFAFDAIDAIGVASAGPFQKRDGLIELVTPNICGGLSDRGNLQNHLPNRWASIALEAQLRTKFADVRIVNDCVAALIAERNWGAARGARSVAYATWSTGVGFAFCVDGQVLLGKNDNAGHAGHSFVDTDDALVCGCGNRGDLESMIGGAALQARYAGGTQQLFADYRRGDAAARELVQTAARRFGRALYNAVAMLDLELIVLGGSVWLHQRDVLLPLVWPEIAQRFPALTRGVQLESAALGEHVTDLGALSLVVPQAWHAIWAQRPWWTTEFGEP